MGLLRVSGFKVQVRVQGAGFRFEVLRFRVRVSGISETFHRLEPGFRV